MAVVGENPMAIDGAEPAQAASLFLALQCGVGGAG